MAVLYQDICEHLYVPVSAERLDTIKNHFRKSIDSNRSFDKVNTIQQLIKILERRDCLSAENVDPLGEIAMYLQKSDLIHMVEKYRGNYQKRTPTGEGRNRIYPEQKGKAVNYRFT